MDGCVRLSIDRIAFGHQAQKRLGRIACLEQGTIGAPLDPAQQNLDVGLEPKGDPLGPGDGPGVRIHEGAATGRQDLGAAFEEPRDHPRFGGAEFGLAVGLEDFRNAPLRGFFDLRVGVDERNAQAGCKPATHGRLAGPHHPHQHDRARPERRHEGGLVAAGFFQARIGHDGTSR